MIVPFRHIRRQSAVERLQDGLAQTVMEVFAHRPVHDLSLAIGAGIRAIERGAGFMAAMETVEGVLRICEDRSHDRVDLMNQRNQERLVEYQIKRAAITNS